MPENAGYNVVAIPPKGNARARSTSFTDWSLPLHQSRRNHRNTPETAQANAAILAALLEEDS